MYNITPANLPAVITVHACTVIYIVLTESTCIALSTLTAVTGYTIYTCSIILTLWLYTFIYIFTAEGTWIYIGRHSQFFAKNPEIWRPSNRLKNLISGNTQCNTLILVPWSFSQGNFHQNKIFFVCMWRITWSHLNILFKYFRLHVSHTTTLKLWSVRRFRLENFAATNFRLFPDLVNFCIAMQSFADAHNSNSLLHKEKCCNPKQGSKSLPWDI